MYAGVIGHACVHVAAWVVPLFLTSLRYRGRMAGHRAQSTVDGFFNFAETHRQRWMFTGASEDLTVTREDSLLCRGSQFVLSLSLSREVTEQVIRVVTILWSCYLFQPSLLENYKLLNIIWQHLTIHIYKCYTCIWWTSISAYLPHYFEIGVGHPFCNGVKCYMCTINY